VLLSMQSSTLARAGQWHSDRRAISKNPGCRPVSYTSGAPGRTRVNRAMKRLPRLMLALALAAIVTAIVTEAAQAKVIARNSGTVVALTSGYAKNPKRIFVDVTDSTAFGGQTVDVEWSVFCIRLPGPKLADRDGNFVSTTPVHRRLPITVKHPFSCVVGATVTPSDPLAQPFVIYLKITAKAVH
jgi:hypothetical protein